MTNLTNDESQREILKSIHVYSASNINTNATFQFLV